ncbi:DUF4998 domain-containing protein [Parapedobacter sp. 10938]|uniref:DUF4998 domain-containing protein n=1 Tax=Parapedobacter flavus TaxID=3110225 RepID=UPI002DBE7BE3|nr:DUF4998 domain-containing protein [Parapedobacter sp. 10938]MEC3878964.1 DUF4998 domain-containing protein [Parapedobacter sp. 10938]
MMKKYNYSLPYLLVLLATFIGCQKQDATYREFIEGGEITYVGKADSIKAFPGKNRLKLQWLLIADPNVSNVRVLWNNNQDVLEVPVNKTSEIDTVSIIIPDLNEGSYLFNVFTYDMDGNSSIRVSVDGQVYGDTYIASLLNRTVETGFFDDKKLSIVWYPADDEEIGTELEYTDEDNVTHTIMVSPNTDTLALPHDFQLGTAVRYRSLYSPDSLSIDTFYTTEYTRIDPNIWYVEPPVELDVELDKSLFSIYPLPGDAVAASFANNNLASLWSGVFIGNQAAGAWYRTVDGSGMPHHFNFDLGVVAKLTSLRVWQRGAFDQNSLVYANANLRKWEIWGSTDPAPDGSYDGWTHLLTCESFKPSGLPVGQRSPEDIEYAQAGDLFEFAEDVPEVRYIRVKVLETWGNTTAMFASEFTFRASELTEVD